MEYAIENARKTELEQLKLGVLMTMWQQSVCMKN